MKKEITEDHIAHAKKVNRYTLAGFSGVFIFIGFILPIFVAHGPNKGLIGSCLMLSAICCWLFWLCAYMAQWHPLIGPKIDNYTLVLLAFYLNHTSVMEDIEIWEQIYGGL